MTREDRVVSISLLIVLLYAGMILIDKGAFIIPFPLNEYILLIVSTQFAVWNWKMYKLQMILAVSTALFGLISTQLFWTFFMDTQNMEKLLDTPSLDILKLIYYILIISWGNIFLFQFKRWKSIVLILLYSSLLISAIVISNYYFEVASYITIAIVGILYKICSPIHILWMLIAVLHVMKIISLNI